MKSTPAAGTTRSKRKRRAADDGEDEEMETEFNSFKDDVFSPFAEDMAIRIEESLEVDPVCKAFACLDVSRLEFGLENCGEEDLETLISWYGHIQHGKYPGEESQVSAADPFISPVETRAEYKTFKKLLQFESSKFIKENRKAKDLCERQLISIKKHKHSGRDKRKHDKLEKELKELNEKRLTLNDLHTIVSKPENSIVIPNMKKLVLLAILSPVGNTVIERLFSLMKITKTVLRNRLGDSTLDYLLRISVEAPDLWTEEDKEQLF